MFEYLPDVAQTAICPLASTPSCPSHVLLARVSKLWGAAALKHFRVDGAGITLQLSCSPDSPTADKLHELGRLESMAAWFKQQGHAVTTFSIQTSSAMAQPDGYVSGRSYGVYNILEALAAAGRRPGGLRLQQVQLPAIGLATPSSLAMALFGCHQLRQLQLDDDCGVGRMGPCGYLNKDLCLALQQLTRLTALKLYAGNRVEDHIPNMDGLFESLPSSLQVLDLGSNFTCSGSSSSLGHLVALRQLTLPYGFIPASSTGHPLCPLTSVTYLDWFCARLNVWEAGVPLPNLVEIEAASGLTQSLTQLAGRTAVRSLACTLVMCVPGTVYAFPQLTQLTKLKLSLLTLANWAPGRLADWGAALSALTGLRSLALQPEVLEQVDLAPLTALTRMEVFATAVSQ